MEFDNLTIDNDTINSISQFIKKNGSRSLEEFTQNQLNQWKNCTLNIAIIGNSGAGKSTLINTILSLRPYDNGAAAVNVIECTDNSTFYIHPENENLKLWDLPGVGTTKYPMNTYVKDMNFEQYDFFLIITKTRFTENDAWLAKEIIRINKKFFFIRTQIDIDIKNTKDDQPELFNEQTLLTKIRNDCLIKLDEISSSIYLISGLLDYNHRWDFPRLITDLIVNFPILKRQAFILAMSPIGTDIIRAKVAQLKKRIWIVATASAAKALIPIPLISVALDIAACVAETEVYQKQLGLTEDVLRKLSEHHQIPFERFSVALTDRISIRTVANIGNLVLSFAKAIAFTIGTEETSKYIPIVGTAIASAASFGSTMYLLNSILNDMEQAALKIQNIIFEFSVNFD